jgi:hypothetical protein
LNLAVLKDFLVEHESLLAKVNGLMVKLKTSKRSAKLKTLTPRSAIKRNKGRWSGIYVILKRYMEIFEYIRTLFRVIV